MNDAPKQQKYQKHLEAAVAAASVGRKLLLDYFGHLSQVQEKGKAGLVSEADLESEQAITAYLKQAFPEIGFIAEEESYKKQSYSPSGSGAEASSFWVIDPLDGTTNYIHQFPIFCISIALQVDGVVEVGVIDVPLLGKTYTAIRGGGAFCNGKEISVSGHDTLKSSLLATGFKSSDRDVFLGQLEIIKSFVGRCRGIRRTGAAAFDLCMVAESCFDIFIEESLKPWDVAAGLLLVNEAGGRVTDYGGKDSDIFDLSILASNGIVHDQVLDILRR